GAFLKAGGKLSIPELETLVTKYIDNWAICDTMSSEVITRVLKKSPEEIRTLYTWVNSKNIWLRRAVLVTIVKLKNKIKSWREIASEILFAFSKENEPIVKKAIHWLERETN
ncbi:MAG: DNA alkylation repair protein, partial [Patescibacteria group bacterium]